MSELRVAEIIVVVVIFVFAVHRRHCLIRRLGAYRFKIVEVEIIRIIVVDRLHRLSSDGLSRCRFSRARLAARPTIIGRAATPTATASAPATATTFLAFAATTIVALLSGGAWTGEVVNLVVVVVFVIISFENVIVITIEHITVEHVAIIQIIKVVAYDARAWFEIVVRLIGFVFASRTHRSRCFAAFAAPTAAASATATSTTTATRFVGRAFGALLRRATRVELFDKFSLNDDLIVALGVPCRRLGRSRWCAFGSLMRRTIFALSELAGRPIPRPAILRRPVT